MGATQMTVFGLGLGLLAVAGVLTAVAVGRVGVVFAAGAVLYLPRVLRRPGAADRPRRAARDRLPDPRHSRRREGIGACGLDSWGAAPRTAPCDAGERPARAGRPRPDTPVVGVAVHVDVGFRSEPEGRTGFAHLFEHLMFQGSESLEKLAHFRHVQGSGGVFNGSTHQDYTDYFEVLPAAALERALFLEADRLRAPKLTEPRTCATRSTSSRRRSGSTSSTGPTAGSPGSCCRPSSTTRSPTRTTATATSPSWSRPRSTTPRRSSTPTTRRATRRSRSRATSTSTRRCALVEKHFGDIPARPTPGPSLVRRAAAGRRAPRGGARTRTPRCPRSPSATGCPTRRADLDGYLGHALLGSVLGDGEAARLQRRLVHVDGLVTDVSAGAGLMGPLDARDPDTFTITAVHPRGRRPGPGARARSTRSSTSSPPKARPTRSWPARSRAGRRRCTRRTTA